MPDARAFGVDPVEAIAFLLNKVDLPTATWTDIWEGEHTRAFVVAGAQDVQQVADFHEAINRAISEGRTLEQFREDFDRIVKRYGWSYHGSRNWRSRVIFETNLRTAYSAGRWQQMQRSKRLRPWLRYVHADPMLEGEHSRPEHAAWHDTVLPIDHPWWDTHFTPNGWGCRCYVQQLNDRDLKRYGLKISDAPPPLELEERFVKGRGMVLVPKGIDPGFGYNPGKGNGGYVPPGPAPVIPPAPPPPVAAPPAPKLSGHDFPDWSQEPDNALLDLADDFHRDWSTDPDFDENGSALSAYGQTASEAINKALRRGETPTGWEQTVQHLDEVFVNFRVNRPLVLYRGLYSDKLRSLQEGDRYADDGFISASLSASAALDFGEGLIKILVPARTPAYPMNARGYARHPNEHEVLLARGGTFVVRENRLDDPIDPMLVVEVVYER